MELVTAAEMRELDRATIETRNIPSLRLMENAGKAVVQEMERFFGPLRGKAITVVAGKGQNGGDGVVRGRGLRKRTGEQNAGLQSPFNLVCRLLLLKKKKKSTKHQSVLC